MPYSPAASGMRCSRRNSLRAWSSISFGMPALAMAASSSAISAALPSSPSPSWRWIAAICSRSSTSRWRSSSAALVWRPISCDSRRTSMRCAEQPRDLVHARRDIDRLEDLLLLFRLHVHIGDGEIGERRRRFDRLDGGEQIGRRLRQQLDRFERLRLQIDEARLDFGRARVRLGDLQHARDQERPAAEIFDDLEALLALADQMMRAVRRGDVAHDIGDRAHAMHVDRGADRRPRRRAATGCRPGADRAPPVARRRSTSAGRA